MTNVQIPMTNMEDTDPRLERFDRNDVTQVMLSEVREICQRSDRTLDDMEQLTMGEIYQLAAATYGGALPEFWRNWHSWHSSWGTGQPGDPPLD
jgi:hypothetical protein